MLLLLPGLIIAAFMWRTYHEDAAFALLIATSILYGLLCFLGSLGRMDLQHCHKSYGIDYVIYTKLFCEIKEN